MNPATLCGVAWDADRRTLFVFPAGRGGSTLGGLEGDGLSRDEPFRVFRGRWQVPRRARLASGVWVATPRVRTRQQRSTLHTHTAGSMLGSVSRSNLPFLLEGITPRQPHLLWQCVCVLVSASRVCQVDTDLLWWSSPEQWYNCLTDHCKGQREVKNGAHTQGARVER